VANTIDDFIVQQLAVGLSVLREECSFVRNLNYRYDKLPGGKNSTVDIPYTTAGTVSDVNPGATPPTTQDTDTATVQLVMDKWRKRDFHVTDRQMDELNANFFALNTQQAVRDLIADINGDVFSSYKEIHGYVETSGGVPFASDVSTAAKAQKLLTDQLAPLNPRVACLSTTAYSNAVQLPAFQYVQNSADTNVQREGMLGRKFGFNWFYDQQTPSHTAGTGTGYLINSAAVAVGDTTVDVDTGSGTIVEGDIFTVAGDTQTYAVQSFVGSTITFSPAAKVAWADDAAVSLKPDHDVSIAMHREAIAFGTRPLGSANEMHNSLGKIVKDMTDPKSGLSLRCVVSSQYNQVAWEFQMLYGYKLVRPEYAARIVST
jgi:hypothetical protein